MSDTVKIHSFTSMKKLVERLRDDFGSGDQDFVLVFAFNGVGKTRLSMAFKDECKRKNSGNPETLYFNAFTEDLFTWDNDLDNDTERYLKLNTDSKFFAGLKELEMDNRIRPLLDRYADFNFRIDTDKWEVSFSREVPDGEGHRTEDGIKISRGEENLFIWCFFLAILQLALDGDPAYEWVEHVYIDDPISSLDEHNAIVVGNHLVQLYREAKRSIRTVVSTHHTLFFNVLHYEVKNHIGSPVQFVLKKDRNTDGYLLFEHKGDTPQFYHVSALVDLWKQAQEENISTYHFNVLRSILEKTAFFHGYSHFGSCIKKDKEDAEGILHQRFVDILSHGKYSMYEPVDMGEQTKEYFRAILQGFVERFPFNPELLPTTEEEKEE